MVVLSAFMMDSAFVGLNVGLYVDSHHWWSLTAAVFCGAAALWLLVMEAVQR